MKKQAFTLVELIVVITILAILGTIAFINLQGYAMEARDSKRLADVYNIQKKIALERVKGIYPSNVMKNGVDISTGLTIGGSMPTDAKQGIVDFQEIKEDEENFKDPIGVNYVYSYSIGGSGTGVYKFVQLSTVNEEKNEAIIVGDYYKIEPADSESIIFEDPINLSSSLVVDGLSILPYSIDNSGGSSGSSSSGGPVLENGLCGSDNGGNFTSNPTNLCSAGTASTVTDNGAGSTYDWTCNGVNGGTNDICSASNTNLTQYPGCNAPDITRGIYTISACNVGSSIAGTGSTSYGNYFQWGRNRGFVYGDSTQKSTLISGSIGLNAATDTTYGFVCNISLSTPYTWANTTITNNWGDSPGTNIARQGPCASGYHVPSQSEWSGIVTAGGWGNNGNLMRDQLKLPYANYRDWNCNFVVSGSALYWTSSPNGNYGSRFSFNSSTIGIFQGFRALGLPIRCFKN